MKINLFITFLFTAIILLLCQCSRTEFDDLSTEKQKANFPEVAKQFGLAVAKELNETVRNLHKKGTDYSNANETVEFKENFYNDFFKASPSAIKTRSTMSESKISLEDFVKRVKNLTKIQLDFIDRIIKECGVTTSYSEFYNRLIIINNDIYNSVPEIQQERLFNITSVLYYGMKEIQNLEAQGMMIPTSQNQMQQLLVKTRSESGGGSFGANCRNFLATTWAIAIGEPTPAGEIVASVVTVVVAGVLLYEVIVCAKRVNCEALYSNCVNSGSLPSWKCYDCYRYCQAQNVWDCPRPY